MTLATSIHAKTGVIPPTFLQNGGGTGLLLQDMDWSRHPLGAPESWPVILRTITSVVLGSQQPMFVSWGPEKYTIYNDGFAAICGHRHPAGMGAPLLDIWSEIRDVLEPMLARVSVGESIQMDDLVVTLQSGGVAQEAHFAFSYTPLRDDTGKVVGLFCACTETTREVRLKRELQISEQFLRSVLGASPDCIKVLDLEGRLTFISDGGRLIMQIPNDQDIQGKMWSSFWQDAGIEQAARAVTLATNGASTAFQAYADTFAGELKYWDVRVTPMLDNAGQPERILVVSRDISYLRQIEDEREQVMQELAHRLRNAFGMVQSVISQTLRHAGSLPEARDILSGRVKALADAQDILTRSVAGEMPIDAVVLAALLPYRTGEGRFTISGPAATISGRQGLGLSLALHELCTNATKYGALSGDSGDVAVNWDVQPDGGFALRWREIGGPAVAPPEKSGFGSVLIEKIVASYFNGFASLEFHPSGVAFDLSGKIAPASTEPDNIRNE